MAKATKQTKLAEIQKVTLSMKQTKDVLKYQLKQLIKNGPDRSGLSLFLISQAGSGKTQLVSQVMKEVMSEVKSEMKPEDVYNPKDYAYFMKEQGGKGKMEVLNLSAKDSQDFSGMPMVDMENKMQSFAQPESIPKEGYGIIFYDEANRVFDLDMKATLLSMWMDRGVNGHYLGDGYLQVAAGNPFDDERYEVEKPDPALAERYRIINLVPTVEEVIEFLETRHKGHFLLDYFKNNKDMCNLRGDEEYAFSPRTIDKGMDFLHSVKNADEKDMSMIRTGLEIYFGVSYAAKIMQYLNNQQDLSFERVINNISLAKKIKKSDVPVATKLLEEIFAKAVEKFLAEKTPLTNDEKEAMIAIAEKCTMESMAVFMKKLATHDGKESELCDFLLTENKPFMKILHKVSAEF